MEVKEDMQILIPMTGYGSRFVEKGYKRLKPFIEVHGKPIIEWVVKMFPGDEHLIKFICRESHLEEFDYVEKTLMKIAPKAEIISIRDWEKKGPVLDVLKATLGSNHRGPVLVSYCDYYMHWDYQRFKRKVDELNYDGSIPCYSGFHPHLIPKENVYGSCKVDKEDLLIEIKEKHAWNQDKTKDLNSPGVFYFKNLSILEKYCQKLVTLNNHINDEFYMSLPFNYLVQDGLRVWCPSNIESFCQWGTPEDLEEYLYWTNTLDRMKNV